MKKIISLTLIALLLSGCSFLRPHKMDVEQGNVYNQEEVSQLKPGMSQSQVKSIMGNPVLENIFDDNRLEYVYTFQPGYGKRTEKRVICIFQNSRLKEILRS